MTKHVLVPLDGSEHAEAAFDFVLTELPDATMTLLHVIEPVGAFGYADPEEEDQLDTVDSEGYQQAQQRRRDESEEMLEAYRERAAARDRTASTVTLLGEPAERIVGYAEDHDVDQIVMGSRGRSGVGRVIFGSVAESVARRSPVPVTVVR